MIRIEHVKHVPDHVLEPRLLQLFLELSANSDYAQVGVTMTLEVSTTVVLRLRRSIVFSLPQFPNQFPNQMCLLVLQKSRPPSVVLSMRQMQVKYFFLDFFITIWSFN